MYQAAVIVLSILAHFTLGKAHKVNVIICMRLINFLKIIEVVIDTTVIWTQIWLMPELVVYVQTSPFHCAYIILIKNVNIVNNVNYCVLQ